MFKNNAPHRDPEIDYEALMVQRNGPGLIQMLRKYRIDLATGKIKLPTAA